MLVLFIVILVHLQVHLVHLLVHLVHSRRFGRQLLYRIAEKYLTLCRHTERFCQRAQKKLASFCRVQLNLMQWQADSCIYRYHESRTTRAGISQTPRID